MPTPPQQNVNVAAQQSAPVMDAMRREKGESGAEKPLDQILMESFTSQGVDPQKGIMHLAEAIKKTGGKVIKIQNSAFLVIPTAPGEAETHMFTTESPKTIARNYATLAKSLKTMGIKKFKTYSDNPQYQNVAKLTGLNVKTTQGTKNIGGQMKPVYVYEVDL